MKREQNQTGPRAFAARAIFNLQSSILDLRLPLLLAALFLSAASVRAADPLGTAFTYQGRLNDGGTPANGNYDFWFKAYDAATGGTQQGVTVTPAALPVSNGLFTVTLDFGPGVFTGGPRWLDIWVHNSANSPNAGWTSLSPRQPLTPAPYAFFATTANTVSGTVLASQLTGALPGASLSGTYSGAVTLNNFSNNLSGNGSGLFGLNAWQLASGTVPEARLSPNVALLNANQTFSGPNSFSGNISLLDPTKSVVFPATGGANSPMMCLFASGTMNADRMVLAHSPPFPDWGLQYQDSLDKFNFLSGGYPVLTIDLAYQNVYVGGRFGIGNTWPYFPLDMAASQAVGRFASTNSAYGSVLELDNNSPAITYYGAINFQGGPGQIGYLTNDIMTFRTAGWERLRIDGNGLVGVGTATPAAQLHASTGDNVPALKLSQTSPWYWCGLNMENADGGRWEADVGFGATPDLMFYAGDHYAFSCDWNGTFSVKVLQINGADVAEPFAISTKHSPKGSVVIIDEENPGQLKLSDRPYDTRVAGILSGANGVRSGISLSQQGFNEGGENVALSGRVYALADAAFGAIKPGDLLTTSATPGHCMKVTDHARAQGAILGKAMGSLSHGKGMVLVLVTLQ